MKTKPTKSNTKLKDIKPKRNPKGGSTSESTALKSNVLAANNNAIIAVAQNIRG